VHERLPELRQLNQNTFFHLAEINDNFVTTQSTCHIIYGDTLNTEEQIDSAGVSFEQFEEVLKRYFVHFSD
jgi:hypothetical protein